MSPAKPAPLHGSKTHPLTGAALTVLACLLEGPEAYSNINPGVINRLMRSQLIDVRNEVDPMLKRPKKVRMIYITAAGRDELRAQRSGDRHAV